MKSLKDFKPSLLAEAEAQAEYDRLADEFEMARELIAARHRAGLTQAEGAQRMGTSQSTIARLESGGRQPSMQTVQRYAKALGYRAVIKLELPQGSGA